MRGFIGLVVMVTMRMTTLMLGVMLALMLTHQTTRLTLFGLRIGGRGNCFYPSVTSGRLHHPGQSSG